MAGIRTPGADTRLRRRFVGFARVAGIATAAVAGVAGLGWVFWLPSLASFLPGRQTMRVDAVLGFLLAGTALYLSLSGRPLARLARPFAAAAAVLGFLALVTHATGLHFGLDRLFPVTTLELRSGPHPSRMAPVAGLLLVLAGVGLALPTGRAWARACAQGCAVAAHALAIFITIGLAYGLFEVASIAPFRNVSAPTALATLLLSAGMLSARPAGGLMGVFTDSAAGGMLARRLLPWAILVPFSLGWAFLVARDSTGPGDTVGIATLVVGNITVLIVLIAQSAAELSRYDQTREVAREALRVSEERFRTALAGSSIIVFNQDRDLRFTWVHSPDPSADAFARLGQRDRDLFTRADEAAAVEQFKRRVIETGTGARREFRVTLPEGRRDFDLRAEPLRDASGTVVGITCAAVDLTEHRRSEEALRHTQKLESLGVLAGGIAHDFNNLLTGILGNASLAIRSLESAEAAEVAAPLLQDVMLASERAADLTRQLLAYAGKGQFVVEPVHLGHLVAELLPLLRASAPRAVHLELIDDPALPLVEADATQLRQLVMNLVINGAEAIATDGGNVTVTLGATEVEDGDAADAAGELPPGRYVRMEVRDTGAGMPPETLDRIFDPFFTTKFLGRGLGLAAAQGIVRGHGGSIRVASVPSQGTVFTVLLPALAEMSRPAPDRARPEPLPAAEQPPAAEPPRPPAAEPPAAAEPPGRAAEPRRHPTVLVTEDEELVRGLARMALESAGYRVLVAEHGADALELVANDRGVIDAVLLDANMPVMNGIETAIRIRAIRPRLPIIVSSGYGEAETLPDFAAVTPHFLPKPYSPDALTKLIAEVLARVSAG